MINRKFSFILVLMTMIFTASVTAQDWPNLKRFQQSNAKVMMKENTNRVVLMGNSITEGWSQINPEFFEGKPYVNRGISGQTTPQMLIRFRQDVVDLNPEMVAILAGINDIAGNTGPSTVEMIFDNIRSMAEIAKSNGISVILCSVLPAYDFPWRPGLEPADKVVKLNELLKKYAMDNQFIYVDYHTAMKNDQNGLIDALGSDGVHPVKEGYEIMGPLLEAGIEEARNQ